MSNTGLAIADMYGQMAEFASEHELLLAATAARRAGFTHLDAYSPFPVHGLADILGFRRSRVPLITLLGGLIGGATGFLLEYWVSAVAYPLNIGGRPLASWPAFVPPAYELTILFSSFGALLAMFFINGLPMPYHPAFNTPGFERASQDRFFLCVEATDPRFDREGTRAFLESLHPIAVSDVAR